MSYRIPSPTPRPEPRLTVALLANVLGLLLIVSGVAGIVVAAFQYDGRAGLAALGASLIGIGFLLARIPGED